MYNTIKNETSTYAITGLNKYELIVHHLLNYRNCINFLPPKYGCNTSGILIPALV